MLRTDEPEVLTWAIALAPRPRPEPVGSHWWRALVVEAWQAADEAWHRDRETVAIGYDTEEREYAEHHPRPRLGDFMRHLSSGHWSPEAVL